MRVTATSSAPTGNLFENLWTHTWGKPLDTLFATIPIPRSDSATDEDAAEAKCLVCGGTDGPLSELLLEWLEVKGILVRAEHTEVIRCIVERATGYHGDQVTKYFDSLPVEIDNPFVDEVYSPSGYRGVAVIGPTGSGKSLFLLLVLILRLSAKQPTVYQTAHDLVLFTDHGAIVISPSQGAAVLPTWLGRLPSSAWCLVDAPLETGAPIFALRRMVVQVAPPQRGKFMKWMEDIKSSQCYMRQWNLMELLAGRNMHPHDVGTTAQIEAFVARCGPRTRDAYRYSQESEGQLSRRVRSHVASIPTIDDFKHAARQAMKGDVSVVHEHLFLVNPGRTRDAISVSLTASHVWEEWTTHSSELARSNARLHSYDHLRRESTTAAAAASILRSVLHTAMHNQSFFSTHLGGAFKRLEEISDTSEDLVTYDLLPHHSENNWPVALAYSHQTFDKVATLSTIGNSGNTVVAYIPNSQSGDAFCVHTTSNWSNPDEHSVKTTIFQAVESDCHMVDTRLLHEASRLQLGNLRIVFVVVPGTTPRILFPKSVRNDFTDLEVCYSTFEAGHLGHLGGNPAVIRYVRIVP
ncbi:hypothetical protein EIP91_009960 [Steccherinum ochraceum]|uniref:Uncharacterized protein n=1 Tax=Steccherinum ochraceum TaxID=92696 RepID=A0A4V2MUZ7_9APHY|nr:hypothetical protein EIP91_009960 [Steccherinum ochraceum]